MGIQEHIQRTGIIQGANDMNIFSSDICHEEILRNRKRSLVFDQNANYVEWREKVKEKLTELFGDMPEKVLAYTK